MADRAPCHRAAAQQGFTLAEMLVALSILTVGVSTLLLALADSASVRRGSDARLVAVQAVEDFVLRVQESGLQPAADAESDLDLSLALPDAIPVEGYPTMTLSAEIVRDESRPFVALLRVRASWLEGGERVAEEFLRVLPLQLPLGARVRRIREQNGISR